jgi:4-amino-4-deoxy-L-arabinose transferase-like glycosyltransferase
MEHVRNGAREGRLPEIFFWGTALLLLFWALGDRGLWGPEGRWAEITRQMFLRRDFFHPSINSRPYFDKPLLTYWLVAAFSTLIGRLNEWSVRLPSAFSGMIGLGVTVYLGRRLWSREVGRIAGWMLLTTYGLLYWGRTGTADMENLAFTLLAVAWYISRRDRLNFYAFLVFYLICFLGAQTKGLTALAVPFLAVFPDLVRDRRWHSLFTPAHFLAFALGLSVYFVPFVYAEMTREGYRENGLFLVFRENILRYVEPFDHVKPFYVYFYYVPAFFLPWAPLLLAAVPAMGISFKNMDRNSRWLMEAAVLIFLFFTISGSRRSYYILPLLPFCALITSVFLCQEGNEKWKKAAFVLQGGLLVIVAAVEFLSPFLWPLVKEQKGFVPPDSLRIALPVIGLLAFTPWVMARFAPNLFVSLTGTAGRRVLPYLLTGTVLMGGCFAWQQPSLEVYRTERSFLQGLNKQVIGPPARKVAFYKVVSPKELFYLDYPGPVPILEGEKAVRDFLETGPEEKVLIVRNEWVEELRSLAPVSLRGKPTWRDDVLPWEPKGSGKWRGNLAAWKVRGELKEVQDEMVLSRHDD